MNNSNSGDMRGSAVILTHPHKQRGEAKGRSTMADLHSWQPSHWLIIREGENGEDGGDETEERWRMRDCRDMETEERGSYRALISKGQSLRLCCLSVCVCVSLLLLSLSK